MHSEKVTEIFHKLTGSSQWSTLVVFNLGSTELPQGPRGLEWGGNMAGGSGTFDLASEKVAPRVSVLLAYTFSQYFIVKMGSSAKNSLKVAKLHP